MSAEIIQEDDEGSTSLFSRDRDVDVVYVAVGESQTSMDALLWTLNNHTQNALVYLLHIYPPLKFIPSPMGTGKVPMSQVSPEMADSYLAQHKIQIRQLLAKYIDKCNAHQVQAETMLIESNCVGNAILELIAVLDIPKLVVGISKSNLSKLRGQKGSSGLVAHQILRNAPVGCEIKIVCQDKDVGIGSASPPLKSMSTAPEDHHSFSCCFKSKPKA